MPLPLQHNKIVSNGTEYIIVPREPLVYEYTMGPSSLRCYNPKFRNPYTSCETADGSIDEICELSHDTNHHLYPSIYSQWELCVDGAKKMTVPNPVTDLTVVIGMQLCKVAPEEQFHSKVHEGLVLQQRMHYCLSRGTILWPSVSSNCVNCPGTSQPALAGYYCENKQL